MSIEEIAKRIEHSLDLFEQGELIDMVAFAEDVRSLITRSAANRVAEESGLSDEQINAIADQIGMGTYSYECDPTVYGLRFARAIIEAERASRHVVNKSEVDLSSLKRYYRSDTSMEHTRKSGGWVKFKDVRELLGSPFSINVTEVEK